MMHSLYFYNMWQHCFTISFRLVTKEWDPSYIVDFHPFPWCHCRASLDCMPVRFCLLGIDYSHLGRGSIKWRNASISMACGLICGLLSWLMMTGGGPAYCGWCHPWAGGPGLQEKAGQQAGLHGFCFSSDPEVLDEINPSLPNLLWIMLDITVTGKWARTGGPRIPVSFKNVHTWLWPSG